MEILSLDEIIKAFCGQIISGDRDTKIKGISTDSRTVKPGDLFFALKGERCDGHRYVTHAMNTGAVGAVISNEFNIEPAHKNFPVIRVKDTTTALGDLARYYRQKLNTTIIGITGSNGKTTTKEMTYHLLSHFGPTAKSQKSFNNFIGVPVTIFEIENRHRYGVLEMGTNAPGEIRRLSEIGAPDVAVIVNISKTHLEGLKSIEGVAQAKAEILENLSKGGVFVYNADNPWCAKIARCFKGKTVGFGFSSQAHIKCTDVKKKGKGYVFELNGHLKFPFPFLGIIILQTVWLLCDLQGIRSRCLLCKGCLFIFKPPSMRIEHQRIGNITIINDAYNANPESVRAALQYLSEIDAAGRKVFVCGDMLELGNESAQLHKEIGETVSHLNIDLLWTVGKYASEIAKAAKSSGTPERQVISFQDVSEITATEINELRENDIVLVKGSRGMHMENIIEKFKELFSKRVPVHNCN